MSEKAGKKKEIKNNKKVTNDKKPITLRLNDGTTVNANTIYDKKPKCFKVNDVNVNKIKVPDKKLCSKIHDSCKYCVFYEHNNKQIPLKLIF